jgi:hypothetical protein
LLRVRTIVSGAALVWPTAGLGAKNGLCKLGFPARVVPTAVAAVVIEAAVSTVASLR